MNNFFLFLQILFFYKRNVRVNHSNYFLTFNFLLFSYTYEQRLRKGEKMCTAVFHV